MTSKIKVDNINKVSDDSNIIKKCGTTTTIGSGASNPIVVDGSAVTIGRCGGTVALASGASQTGFGREGSVNWQTGSIKTSTFTATSGEGYFANTSGGAFNMNLPAGVAGAIVSVADYAESFASNNLTIVPNGSDKIGGQNQNAKGDVKGQSITLVFVDSTQGWINTMDSTSNVRGLIEYMTATGGTITTSGNFKIHTFTGPGTFTVCALSTVDTDRNKVDYVVVAGGSGGGNYAYGAGGGAGGGFRESYTAAVGGPYTASPLATPTSLPVSAQGYPIVVGSGGAGAPSGSSNRGCAGSVSSFSTITSTGGGAAGAGNNANGGNGGSGGGGGGGSSGGVVAAGSGNTPPVSPPQGNNGGAGIGAPAPSEPSRRGGGGGGAGGTGTAATQPAGGSNGGAGVTTGAKSSPATTPTGPGGFSGGAAGSGGGGPYTGTPGGFGAGNASFGNGGAGATNSGAGGGASGANGSQGDGGNGGSGMVVIRYRFQ